MSANTRASQSQNIRHNFHYALFLCFSKGLDRAGNESVLVYPIPSYSATQSGTQLTSSSWLAAQPPHIQLVHPPFPYNTATPAGQDPLPPFPTHPGFGRPLDTRPFMDSRPSFLLVELDEVKLQRKDVIQRISPPKVLQHGELVRVIKYGYQVSMVRRELYTKYFADILNNMEDDDNHPGGSNSGGSYGTSGGGGDNGGGGGNNGGGGGNNGGGGSNNDGGGHADSDYCTPPPSSDLGKQGQKQRAIKRASKVLDARGQFGYFSIGATIAAGETAMTTAAVLDLARYIAIDLPAQSIAQ